jgi:MFS family permease
MDARYVVVAGACLTQFTTIGLLFSVGLFLKVFETEFGWSRTLLSACSAASFLAMGILAMVAGRLSDRFGPTRVLAVSGLIYGAGFALMSQIAHPWQLFAISAVFLGIGLSTHDVVTLSTVARWFEKRRGMMTALVKVGTALGQVAAPPVTAALIVGLGWRATLVVLGAGAAVLLLTAALMMRAPPLRPVAPGMAAPGGGASFAEARRGRVLRTLCAVQFLTVMSLMTVPLHIAVHGMDLGMSAARAATLLSVIGGASIAGRLTVGRLADVIGGRLSFALNLALLVVAMAGLAAITAFGPLHLVVAVYGFAHGGVFVVGSLLVADYFGMRAHGAIFGTVLFFGNLGGAIGPVLAGLVFDLGGSYLWAFLGLMALAGVALGLVLSLPAPPRREG